MFHSQATHFMEHFMEKLFTLEAVACEQAIQATVSDNPHRLLPGTWVFMRSRQSFCNLLLVKFYLIVRLDVRYTGEIMWAAELHVFTFRWSNCSTETTTDC